MGEKPQKINTGQNHAEGVIFVARRGMGFVSDSNFDKDIEIQNQHLDTALSGDTVKIEVLGKKGDRFQGRVEEVINRAKTRFVGTLHKDKEGSFLRPDSQKMHIDISLAKEDVSTIEEGTKIYVEMNEWTNARKNPTGKVLEVIGKKGTHEVEMQSIIFEHGFETQFARRIEEEAKQIAKEKPITDKDVNTRRDMRGITTFTIDPHDAKDFDDAISLQKLPNGDVEIGIHIADVTHYVRPGSGLEEEARDRATSIYLVDRTIPMLPEVLSNDVCSLVQGEDRRTFSAVFVLDENAGVKDRWFGETIIHSNKRFSYEEAQDILNKGDGLLVEELKIMDALAKKLRAKRNKNGAVSFDQDEVAFELDKKGVPVRIYKKKRQDTNKMIEDFMLLANEEVATHMYSHKKKTSGKDNVFIYRIHDKPDPDRIEELGIFIRAIGYEFDTNGGNVSAKNINKLFDQIKGKPEENLIKVATIRSMAKAVYSTKNIGHFGLAFKYYTHFTSPIRRYPDMMVHRIMKNHLKGTPPSDKEIAEYNSLAIKSSSREVEAVQAERDSIKYKQVEYMLSKVGEEFKGVVTGVTDFGIFVEEVETKAEGLVRMSSIGGDYYTLDQQKYRVVGERTKRSFTLGDPVRVKLTAASLDSRTLDFKFLN
jgi:ribonuclease R